MKKCNAHGGLESLVECRAEVAVVLSVAATTIRVDGGHGAERARWRLVNMAVCWGDAGAWRSIKQAVAPLARVVVGWSDRR